jgi:hypothetical protein
MVKGPFTIPPQVPWIGSTNRLSIGVLGAWYMFRKDASGAFSDGSMVEALHLKPHADQDVAKGNSYILPQ